MKLNELLKQAGKTEADITKIYHGKNHWCRCGCGGRYFYKNEGKGFNRALNLLNKEDFVPGDYEDVEISSCYVNIPEGAEYQNKCYCVYFD